jgi:hypothetical protein
MPENEAAAGGGDRPSQEAAHVSRYRVQGAFEQEVPVVDQVDFGVRCVVRCFMTTCGTVANAWSG